MGDERQLITRDDDAARQGERARRWREGEARSAEDRRWERDPAGGWRLKAERGGERAAADRLYLAALAERGWSSWAIPPGQAAERERLWEEARRRAKEGA